MLAYRRAEQCTLRPSLLATPVTRSPSRNERRHDAESARCVATTSHTNTRGPGADAARLGSFLAKDLHQGVHHLVESCATIGRDMQQVRTISTRRPTHMPGRPTHLIRDDRMASRAPVFGYYRLDWRISLLHVGLAGLGNVSHPSPHHSATRHVNTRVPPRGFTWRRPQARLGSSCRLKHKVVPLNVRSAVHWAHPRGVCHQRERATQGTIFNLCRSHQGRRPRHRSQPYASTCSSIARCCIPALQTPPDVCHTCSCAAPVGAQAKEARA